MTEIELLDRYKCHARTAPEVAARMEKLKKQASDSGLDPAILNSLTEAILPNLVCASRLARRYHDWSFWSVTTAYALSALAVATASFGALLSHSAVWFFVEAAEIVGVGMLAWPSWRQERLRRWIDFRYLAERLRASCFLYVAGLAEETSEPPPDMQLSWLPHNWVSGVVQEAWSKLPPLPGGGEEAAVRKFIFAAWIEAQRVYYETAALKDRRWHESLETCLKLILPLTFLAAVAHVWFHHRIEGTALANWLSLLAVTLPAVAGALAGIDVFGHFDRNAERYESMKQYLEQVGRSLSENTPLLELLREADRWMAHEHQGWRVVFGERLPGPG